MSVRTVAAAETSFLLREHGAGDDAPAVLLLHGVPETSSCWKRLAPALASGRRVLAPDLPGLGGSSYSGPYDVPSLVRQLEALVEAETGGRPVDVVGHDWGGSLALALAGARPDLVRRLAVANAPYRSVPLLRAVHIPFFALPAAPELLFRLGGRRVVRLMLGIGWRASTPLDGETLAEYEAAYSNRASVRAMLGYYRAATRPRLAAAVRRRRMPGRPRVRADRMLVLWGARDPVLPVSTGESVVKDLGPDCVMVTVPGAGHFVVEEAPDVVRDVLVDFLGDGVSTQAAPPESPAPPRVAAVEPASADLGDVPSVGPVPVGGAHGQRETAEQPPGRPAKRAGRPATKRTTTAPVRTAPTTPAAAPAKRAAATPAKRAATPAGKKAAATTAKAAKSAASPPPTPAGKPSSTPPARKKAPAPSVTPRAKAPAKAAASPPPSPTPTSPTPTKAPGRSEPGSTSPRRRTGRASGQEPPSSAG